MKEMEVDGVIELTEEGMQRILNLKLTSIITILKSY
jgi:hypothetical protein